MKYLKQGTVSQLENDTFRAKGVLYAHDIPKVLWCEQPEAGTEFTISYNAETGETTANAIIEDKYEYVDLGLPSGLLWAKCNVGASKPEEYGLYFQWGATEGYEGDEALAHSTWSTAPFQTQNTTDAEQTKFTKYLGSVDSPYKDPSATDENALKTVLDQEDDAARANMGGDWRMPKSTEFQELYDNTTNEWTTENGVYGRKFTASNGNYIFIPAAGYCLSGSVYGVGALGYVWSSSLYTSYPYYAYYLRFNGSDVGPQVNYRYLGRSVRGVKNPS